MLHCGQSGVPNSNTNFPFELQVSQLLQENLIIISSMRSNLRSVKVGDNLPLMENFYKNMQSVFSMLSALPCAIPPLPSQYRIKDDFIRHLSSATIDEAAASSEHNALTTAGSAVPALSTSTSAGTHASTGGMNGNTTHGEQAGMAFPNHPSSIRTSEAGTSMLAGSVGSSSDRNSKDDATALQIHMAPPTVQTCNLGGSGSQAGVLDGVGGVLGASPANALQALPLGQPAPPPER